MSVSLGRARMCTNRVWFSISQSTGLKKSEKFANFFISMTLTIRGNKSLRKSHRIIFYLFQNQFMLINVLQSIKIVTNHSFDHIITTTESLFNAISSISKSSHRFLILDSLTNLKFNLLYQNSRQIIFKYLNM